MLFKLEDPLYCREIYCYCEKEVDVLYDIHDKTKIYYKCKTELACGYFILAKGITKCDTCNVYYNNRCVNPFCYQSDMINTLDDYINYA